MSPTPPLVACLLELQQVLMRHLDVCTRAALAGTCCELRASVPVPTLSWDWRYVARATRPLRRAVLKLANAGVFDQSVAYAPRLHRGVPKSGTIYWLGYTTTGVAYLYKTTPCGTMLLK